MPPPSSQGKCPACDRFIGPAATCPFCDVDIPQSRSLQFTKTAAWLLALVGTLMLWVAATHYNPEHITIKDISPAMNFANINIQGTITKPPRVARNQKSLSFTLSDPSGEIRIVCLDQAAQVLIADLTNSLAPHKDIRVYGSLSIKAGKDPVLFVKNPDNIQHITP